MGAGRDWVELSQELLPLQWRRISRESEAGGRAQGLGLAAWPMVAERWQQPSQLVVQVVQAVVHGGTSGGLLLAWWWLLLLPARSMPAASSVRARRGA